MYKCTYILCLFFCSTATPTDQLRTQRRTDVIENKILVHQLRTPTRPSDNLMFPQYFLQRGRPTRPKVTLTPILKAARLWAFACSSEERKKSIFDS
jgi:hypothetical protein